MISKENLHIKTKQFVYQIIMTFKEFDEHKNESLIQQIKQSATRLSAHCRNICETSEIKQISNSLTECRNFLNEIIHLLNLLDNTETFERISIEEILLQAFELKQEIKSLCD
ncbi:MAG: four helix bundle protein [Bacteroidales bacterium]|nr:four helix bundle protein [Bacteroidales bacterium]